MTLPKVSCTENKCPSSLLGVLNLVTEILSLLPPKSPVMARLETGGD